MAVTTYTADLIKVEIFTIAEDNFVLGLSRLGFETLGGSGTEPEWREIQCDANRITMRRGGSAGGVTSNLDAGYLNITLVNSGNPITDPGILPSVPVRVSAYNPRYGNWVVIFTGKIEDVSVRFNKKQDAFVTLKATDAVREFKNIKQYGSWTAPNQNISETSAYYAFYYLMTGNGFDGYVQWNPMPPPSADINTPTVETLTPSSGWVRWGPAPSGVTEEPLTTTPTLKVHDGLLPTATSVDISAFSRGVSNTITGLEVGMTYFASVSLTAHATGATGIENPELAEYALGVDIGAETIWGPSQVPNQYYTDKITGVVQKRLNMASVSFRATSTTHTVRISRAVSDKVNGNGVGSTYRPEDFNVSTLTVKRTSSGGAIYPVQDVNYESSLANHLDLVSNASGADWYITRQGSLGARNPAMVNVPGAVLSDVKGDGNICYTDIDISYDTQNSTNYLQVNNHGAQNNPERPEAYLVRDTNNVYADQVSIDRYGPRANSIDMRIAPCVEIDRAADILEALSNPNMVVNSVTFNALEYVHDRYSVALHTWELYDTIRVEYQDFKDTYFIVGVQHDIGPESWMTTFNLRRIP